ncbi:MAG TPA: hypothetical protein VNS50_03485 [Ginsengibacter sp.]|nr:hypothetical protein [Ginsengibacter sp.]
MRKFLMTSFITVAIIIAGNCKVSAQSDKPYTEGPVWQVQFVSAKPGMTQLYLKNLSEGWVKEMRAAKDAGLIMDFKVLQAPNASENDWNLMLMYELKNYAALDGMSDKMQAIGAKLFGSEDTQHASAVSRNDLRTLMGGKLAQELDFK